MKGIVLRWVVNAGGLLLVGALFDGVHVAGVGWALVAAAFLGIMNALIRPLVLILTLPINVLSLGLFTLVVNGFMLWLVGKLLRGFSVEGFWTAVGAALIMSIISLALSSLVGSQGRVDVIDMRLNQRGDWERR